MGYRRKPQSGDPRAEQDYGDAGPQDNARRKVHGPAVGVVASSHDEVEEGHEEKGERPAAHRGVVDRRGAVCAQHGRHAEELEKGKDEAAHGEGVADLGYL